jgi:hypothetical protein
MILPSRTGVPPFIAARTVSRATPEQQRRHGKDEG